MTEHTPTPWVDVENDEDSIDWDKVYITTDDRVYKSLIPIAEVSIGYSEPMNSEQIANAAFLVRAVNSHDELVATLTAIKTIIGNVDYSRGGGENTARLYGEMLNCIRDAVAAALSRAGKTGKEG